MKIFNVRHCYPERAGWELKRNNSPDYIFLHFLSPAVILCGDEYLKILPGNAIVFSPFTKQHLIAPKDLTHNWIHLDKGVVPIMSKYGLRTDTLYTPSYMDKITNIVQVLESEFFVASKDFDQLSELKLNELFFYMSRDYSLPAENYNDDNRFLLNKLRQNLLSDITHDWSIDKICSYTSMSKTRLFSLYKSIFGISPINDLIRARIQHAKSLLSQKHYTNAELCTLCGFNNEYYFIRQFKALSGLTPYKYYQNLHK